MSQLSHTHIALELERPIWFSGLQNMRQDIKFIEVLLNAKIYRNGIPNLFEGLVQTRKDLKSFSNQLHQFENDVVKFAQDIKELSFQNDVSFETFKYSKYKHFIDQYSVLEKSFLEKKTTIFNYLESVLIHN